MSVALVFSPQGSQAVGMGRDLADGWPAAARVYASSNAALGWDVAGTCWNGPEDRLNDTRQTQPCLVATCLATLAALRTEVELQPAYVAGHSVGEYAALVAAGTLAADDALRLVARRAELMAEAAPAGGMSAVIGMERAEVAAVVAAVAAEARGSAAAGELVVANDNAPGQVVISGTRQALDAVEQPLRDAGARRVIPLRVSGPFHSPMMSGVGAALADAFSAVEWHDADPPVVSNVTAEPVSDAATIRELLARQVSSPVEWISSVRRMTADGVDTFVEVGPGGALSGMVRRIEPGVRTLNASDRDSLLSTAEALATSLEASVRP